MSCAGYSSSQAGTDVDLRVLWVLPVLMQYEWKATWPKGSKVPPSYSHVGLTTPSGEGVKCLVPAEMK